MAADLKPNVVVIDLHMPDERGFSPDFIKSQFLLSTNHLLAISVWNDEQSKALASRYGAKAFLDKSNLGSELIPAILFYGEDARYQAS
jgi:DNA-binding NarL/FixJ family response regulator